MDPRAPPARCAHARVPDVGSARGHERADRGLRAEPRYRSRWPSHGRSQAAGQSLELDQPLKPPIVEQGGEDPGLRGVDSSKRPLNFDVPENSIKQEETWCLKSVLVEKADGFLLPGSAPRGVTNTALAGVFLLGIRAANHDLLFRYRAAGTVWELLNPVPP